MSIIDQIARMLDDMESEGREPTRILLGHADARELEVELHPLKLPYPMTGRVTLYGVPIERVDQERLVGVVGEGE